MRPEYQGLAVSVNTVMPTPYAITFQLESEVKLAGHMGYCSFLMCSAPSCMESAMTAII
jgi:hypothetical protein